MEEKDIYNLNKSLYEKYSQDILSAIEKINNLYPNFDGDKKVFENTKKFKENGNEIWMPNNKGHEFCHVADEYINGYIFFFKIWYPNQEKIRRGFPNATCRLYLAFQERLYTDNIQELKGYPDVDLFRIEYERGLDKWHGLHGTTSINELKEDEAINKFREIILDHSKIIEKSKKNTGECVEIGSILL